ncbi:MAG: hypothetical protein WD046_10030 [Paracoccaceae bacterium]
MHEPITLGDILTPAKPVNAPNDFGMRLRSTAYLLLSLTLLTAIFALPIWWFLMRPNIETGVLYALLVALTIFWLFASYLHKSNKRPRKTPRGKSHFLLENDRQGFMRALRLDAKTAIFDGSNIYHFGRANGLDAQPLGELAYKLRTEGYRIVCFFDANIFYTLNEHGAFPSSDNHSAALLHDIFGLARDEIYVVPSGVQADKYVLETLKHLPISFAVTNDQYRDYAQEYASVMRGAPWRKAAIVSKTGVKLR